MKVGLSLGGGGALGYAHIGAIRAFEEAGIPIDIINGSSMGAVVGGTYALCADVDKMTELVGETLENVDFESFNIFKYREHYSLLRSWLSTALCDISMLRSSFVSHKEDVKALRLIFGENRFSDTRIPFSCVAVDLLGGDIVTIAEGDLVEGILPSMTLPGVFPPIEREDRLLVDGSVLADVPVHQLRAQGADFVIAIRLSPKVDWWYQTGSDVLNLVEMMKESLLAQWEMEDAEFSIEMNLPDVKLLDFGAYEQAITRGYEVAADVCDELKRRLDN